MSKHLTLLIVVVVLTALCSYAVADRCNICGRICGEIDTSGWVTETSGETDGISWTFIRVDCCEVDRRIYLTLKLASGETVIASDRDDGDGIFNDNNDLYRIAGPTAIDTWARSRPMDCFFRHPELQDSNSIAEPEKDDLRGFRDDSWVMYRPTYTNAHQWHKQMLKHGAVRRRVKIILRKYSKLAANAPE